MMNAGNSDKKTGFDPFVLSLLTDQAGSNVNPMMMQMLTNNKAKDMGPLLPLFMTGKTNEDPLLMMLLMVKNLKP